MILRREFLSALVVIAGVSAGLTGLPGQLLAHSATTPESREEMKGWRERHESFNKRAAEGDAELIFIGDSITQGWESEGKQAWEKHFAKRKAMNLGIGGDRTQHVLWRLDHGNVEGISPKLAVVMIGTNNSNGKDNTADEIADGITAIVKKLRAKLPKTKVLLLAIFPRGEREQRVCRPPGNSQRDKNALASQLASKTADGQMVYYMDIGDKFLSPDGSISKDIMPDLLHLTSKGYELWAEAIEPKVAELMGEMQPAAAAN